MNEREIEFLARCHPRFWDSLSTQAARSYLTRFKCARPMRIASRMTSCSAASNCCAANDIPSLSSSEMRSVFITKSFFSSFMNFLCNINEHVVHFKKVINMNTFILT